MLIDAPSPAGGRESAITALVNRHVPLARRQRRHGRELSYVLPHDAVDAFAPLFVDIERAIADERTTTNQTTTATVGHRSLGISSYGVSMTTLEEVFLRLENEEGDGDAASDARPDDGTGSNAATSAGDDVSSGGATAEPDALPADLNGSDALSTSATVAVDMAAANATGAAGGDGLAWLALDSLHLRPSARRTLVALLRLRCLIMLRDLQRLYLMIGLPLVFVAVGLYMNSIQVGDLGGTASPTVEVIILLYLESQSLES